jgi:hypothetical protein
VSQKLPGVPVLPFTPVFRPALLQDEEVTQPRTALGSRSAREGGWRRNRIRRLELLLFIISVGAGYFARRTSNQERALQEPTCPRRVRS